MYRRNFIIFIRCGSLLVDVVEKEKEIELEGVETARQEISEELINEANKLALDFWNLVKNPKNHEQTSMLDSRLSF